MSACERAERIARESCQHPGERRRLSSQWVDSDGIHEVWRCGVCAAVVDETCYHASDPHRDAEERIYQKSQSEGTETA